MVFIEEHILRCRLSVVGLIVIVALAAPSGIMPVTAQTAVLVCIDPGHGGSETGSSGGGILEKDLNLNVAFNLGAELQSRGYAFVYTRTDDTNPSRTARAQFCNAAGATVLISVHHNGSSNTTTNYTTALYQKRVDKPLAAAVSQAVAPATTGSTPRTGQFASAVLLKSDMPATISEGYFLTNPGEQVKLSDFTGSCTYCQTEAAAIANGISAYLGV